MPSSASFIYQKRAALLAGAALLAMALLAPIAFFAVLEPIRTAGDAAAQVSALQAAEPMFRLSIVIFLTVAVLDILVAWGLHGVFSPVNRHLSLLAVWFRLVYTALLLVATVSLIETLNLLQLPTLDTVQRNLLVQHELNGFFTTFNFGLGIFGGHLMVLGYMIIRTNLLHGFLGALLVVAGLGYLADTLGTVLIDQYGLNLASVTFFGEVLLIGWLFWWGWRRPSHC